ncbi:MULTISPECIES: hypothetical protein [Acidobacteriaceae]|uniref:hypothetical protein n=1 Tax=Acidobacteriaceae TaxID=204434 RepID=UPI00131BBDA5|nr:MULTISPECIES: hypothetical protein [Acidobacteriaceae]MDW5265597.1 hypothetical protein [Edaphobacter sp.]
MALKLKYFAITAALFIALTFCFERPAYGYVDPGSSLLIFQSLSAIVTGTIFYFRRRLKALFSRSSTDTTDVSSKSR